MYYLYNNSGSDVILDDIGLTIPNNNNFAIDFNDIDDDLLYEGSDLYNAISNGTLVLTDDGSIPPSTQYTVDQALNILSLKTFAEEVVYDDSQTSLGADTTQEAIEKLNEKIENVSVGDITHIIDADKDTSVDVEKTADDDIIRFATFGVERGKFTKDGDFIVGNETGTSTITHDFNSDSDYIEENSDKTTMVTGNLKLSGISWDNIVAYYHMNESSWNGTPGEVTDETSNYNGTSVNGASTIAAGKLNRAGSFTSSSHQYFRTGWHPPENSSLSASFWMKLNSVSGSNQTFGEYVSGARFYFGLASNSNFFIGVGDTYKVDTPSNLNANTWYHWVIVFDFDAKLVKVYIDNEVKYSFTADFTQSGSNEFYVGARNGSANYIDGFIDDLSLWTRVLTDDEISFLYNNGNGIEFVNGFDTSQGWYVTTSNANRIDISNSHIHNILISDNNPPNTQTRWLFSDDDRNTWYYWNGSSWSSTSLSSIDANGNTKSEVESLTTTEWDQLFNGDNYLNYAVSLKTTNNNATPEQQSLVCNLDVDTSFSSMRFSGAFSVGSFTNNSAPEDNSIYYNSTENHLLYKYNNLDIRILDALGEQQILYIFDQAGNLPITNSWTDIIFDTVVREDSFYSFSNSEITFNKEGWYDITYYIDIDISSGTSRSESYVRLVEDIGSGYIEIPGTTSILYHRTSAQGATNASVTISRRFNVGDKIKLQAKKNSGNSNLITAPNSTGIHIRAVNYVAPEFGEVNSGNNLGSYGVGVYINKTGTTLNFKNIRSTNSFLEVADNTSSNTIDLTLVKDKILYIYKSGGQNINNTWRDITFDSTILVDLSYTFNNPEIVFNEDGTYKITYSITINAGTSTRTKSGAKLVINDGSGYTDLYASKSFMYHRTSAQGATNASVTVVIKVGNGYKIKLQARRISGSASLSIVANSTSIYIEKLRV